MSDASSRFLWPPTIFGGAALAGLALTRLAPLALPGAGALMAWTGYGLIALGCAVALAAEFVFWRAGTNTLPTRPTTTIVATGIYRVTRNPMYLGMTLALVGMGPALGSAWFVLAAPVCVYAVTKLAIEREEAYLAAKFGASYLAYKARVRRWF
ncbi:MAG: isoprenylcysteine carboxylmethyltransferase family protein [Rhizobiales bacterium]|nr:isoprenylcysteine carboxylmethyltransferase family protein [Hyphomicrobiales bacterium]